MDVYSKNKYLFWSVIVLVILNIALLTIFGLGMFRQHGRPLMPFPPNFKPDRFHAKDFLDHELKMDENQKKEFGNIMANHFEGMDKIMFQIMEKRKNIFDEIFQQNPDQAKIESLTNDVGNLHKELEKVNSMHFNKLKSLMRPEQIVKLKEILGEAVNPKRLPINPNDECRPRPEHFERP